MARRGIYERWQTEKGLTALETWARLGLTDEDIAKNIGIHVATLYEWKNKYSDIAEALTYGKQEADAIVENALYKRAVGYDYEEVTKELRINPETKEREMVVTKIVTKNVIPDTTAQIFWLKNRKQDMWRDKQELDTTISGVDFTKEIGKFIDKI